MPFIGDFSLQKVRSKFQRQTKKNYSTFPHVLEILHCSYRRQNFLILASVGTEKRHFDFRISLPFLGFEISTFSL